MPHERMFHHEHAHKLHDAEREKFLPFADVIARIGLRDGMTVADIGAGTGYFAIPIARAVGRVMAVDVQPEMLERLRARITGDLPITLVSGSAEKTTLDAASVDLAFYANVWHEIDDRSAALAEAKRILRPGGRVAIVDWRPEAGEHGPPLGHRLAADLVARELRAAGFETTGPATVGTYHYVVIGERA